MVIKTDSLQVASFCDYHHTLIFTLVADTTMLFASTGLEPRELEEIWWVNTLQNPPPNLQHQEEMRRRIERKIEPGRVCVRHEYDRSDYQK